jgi:dihydrofolate synthase / folylpolyglutamate synthase
MRIGDVPYRAISVAGTNGKGSTVHYAEAILQKAGYRVGSYTSPHLFRFNERIRVNGIPATDHELCNAFNYIEQLRDDTSLTYFEFGTLVAYRVFQQQHLDYAVLEVGMGGRLDAVNGIDADVAVITSIGIDHTEWLGPDRESIGQEKAGIFRPRCPAVYGETSPPQSVLRMARERATRLLVRERDFFVTHGGNGWNLDTPKKSFNRIPYPPLVGERQVDNAACALMALETVVPSGRLSSQVIAQGISSVKLPGRFQQLPCEPPVILDVAHNLEAVTTMTELLRQKKYTGPTYAVFSILKDKPIEPIIRASQPLIDHWFIAELECDRAASKKQLVSAFNAQGVENFTLSHSTSAAWSVIYLRFLKLEIPMTKKQDNELDFNPKHRITGAVILISLAIIFIPIILDKTQPPKEIGSLEEIPAPDLSEETNNTKVVVSSVEKLNDTSRASSSADKKAESESDKNKSVKEATAHSKPAPVPESGQTTTPSSPALTDEVKNPPSQQPDKGWVVQFGTFSNSKNATRLIEQLRQNGHKVNEEKIRLKDKNAVRIRVGPFEDKDSASKALAKIKHDIGIEGVILAYP